MRYEYLIFSFVFTRRLIYSQLSFHFQQQKLSTFFQKRNILVNHWQKEINTKACAMNHYK